MVPLILVVDDDKVHLRLLDVVLTQIGYSVRTASSGEDALDVIRRIRPRMILLGLQLPGMSGLDLTRRLRTHAAIRDVVIIAVTVAASQGDIDVALASGCDDHVVKSDRRHLVELVRRHLPT
jgi:CheY-like chemotaxis protein